MRKGTTHIDKHNIADLAGIRMQMQTARSKASERGSHQLHRMRLIGDNMKHRLHQTQPTVSGYIKTAVGMLFKKQGYIETKNSAIAMAR